jgi:hypothetical protein
VPGSVRRMRDAASGRTASAAAKRTPTSGRRRSEGRARRSLRRGVVLRRGDASEEVRPRRAEASPLLSSAVAMGTVTRRATACRQSRASRRQWCTAAHLCCVEALQHPERCRVEVARAAAAAARTGVLSRRGVDAAAAAAAQRQPASQTAAERQRACVSFSRPAPAARRAFPS